MMFSKLEVLDENGVRQIIENACLILEKNGVRVENSGMVKKLSDFGGIADTDKQTIYFKSSFVQEFLERSVKISEKPKPVKFVAQAKMYQGYYLNADGEFQELREKNLLELVKLSTLLPNVGSMYMLGCPIKEVPVHLQPLYEKLYCWKYGIAGGNSIWTTGLCEKMLEMWNLYADETGKKTNEIFNGRVFMVSPLKLCKEEAEQFMFFYEKGLATSITTMGSIGGNIPVTLAGAMSVQLAEIIFINIVNRAFFGRQDLLINISISNIDMSTGMFQYGRPEKILSNIAGAQIAKYLGAEFMGQCGQSDAKVPGYEAGVQKVSSAVLNAMACGHGHIAAGMLGVDEIFSPIQMILDNEIVGSLNRVCNGFEVNKETLALDAILEAGSGEDFFASEHTVENFRANLWETWLWSKEMFSTWKDSGRKTELDKAKEKYKDILNNNNMDIVPLICAETEKKLLQIIND